MKFMSLNSQLYHKLNNNVLEGTCIEEENGGQKHCLTFEEADLFKQKQCSAV